MSKTTRNRNLQQKLEVYVIAGARNVGKSSVIRHLTGLHSTKVIELADTKGNGIGIYAKIQSLQEAKIKPSSFIRIVTNVKKLGNISAIIVALRTDTTLKADVYIDEFIKAGWNIKYVAELGIAPGRSGFLLSHSRSNKYKYQTFMSANYINQLASQMRNFFNLI